jgi:hypothetical protein
VSCKKGRRRLFIKYLLGIPGSKSALEQPFYASFDEEDTVLMVLNGV